MTAPLSGVKVLDLGQGAAGPYCGQLLGDHGADVIKLEPPRGDWARTLGSIDPATGLSSTYLAMNRNKRGVCLDLGDPRGVELTRRLAAGCDVLIESFRPGVMDRLGLGYDELATPRRDLVYCSITGFGSSGPMAQVAASDSMMQPYAGLMSIVGEPDGPPLRVGTVVSDMLAGSNAFSAVLLALLRRGRDGVGARIEVNLLDSLLAFQSTGIVEHLVSGRVAPPPGNRHPLIGASGVARAKDGWLAIGVLDQHWAVFCELLDVPALSSATFATGTERLSSQDALWEILERELATRTVDEWLDLLRPKGIVCGSVQDYASLLKDPQVSHNGTITHASPGVAPPLRLDSPWQSSDLRPPRIGEHTREILLKELQLTREDVDELERAGVARSVPG